MAIHDGRGPTSPPSDSLAECVVLRHVLEQRDLIDTLDLRPLLTLEEHRRIWDALVCAHEHTPRSATFGTFYVAWFGEAEAIRPHLADVLLVGSAEADRKFEEWDAGKLDDPALSHYAHNFDYWLARLRRIHEARQIMWWAQAINERAYKVPERPFTVDDAIALISRALPPPLVRAPPVWERADAW